MVVPSFSLMRCVCSTVHRPPFCRNVTAASRVQIDAIGTKRFDSDKSGDREVQRTMLELLNQLDGFSTETTIKVIAATNRPDTLDPALLRSGRLDRKIELPAPTEDARARIMQIHSRKMNIDKEGASIAPLAVTLSFASPPVPLPFPLPLVQPWCPFRHTARCIGAVVRASQA